MTKPVAEQLAPLEALLRAATPAVRSIVERDVRRAIGRWKGIRCASPSDAVAARLRLEVLRRHLAFLQPKPVENPIPPNEKCERDA